MQNMKYSEARIHEPKICSLTIIKTFFCAKAITVATTKADAASV